MRNGTGPDPKDLPRPPRTHDQGTTPAKAVVSTQCYAPALRLGSPRASPWGSHWRQARTTCPAAPAARATAHQGGGAVGKCLQPLLLSNRLTRGWRNGEAVEGLGSEPREPGGLRHQAGGVS